MAIAPVHRLKKDEIIWLSRNKCRHGHNFLEHYNCYLTENPDKCRVGYFDIESSNLKADMGFVIAWYILDEKGNYHGRTITKEELYKCTYPDQKLMKELVKELKNYDIIRTYYGTKFDLPFIRTRCVIQNLEFPFYGTLKHKDIYYTIKSKFSLVNKKLETACEMLLGDSNKTKWSVKHWVGAIQGKQKSLDYIDEHCFTPDHKVLRNNLEWDELGNLKIGDKIVSFEENSTNGYGRKYKEATIESINFTKAPVFAVELSTGQILKVTKNHQWLTCNPSHNSGANFQWMKTYNLRTKKSSFDLSSKVCQIIPVTNKKNDYDTGYLSAMIDGEGWLNKDHLEIRIAQRPGTVFDKIIDTLDKKTKNYKINLVDSNYKSGLGKKDCKVIRLNGDLPERLGLLQELQPAKLQEKINIDNWGRMERRKNTEISSIKNITEIGIQDIIEVGTSTGTLFVDGFPMHNCRYDVLDLKRLTDKVLEYAYPVCRSI